MEILHLMTRLILLSLKIWTGGMFLPMKIENGVLTIPLRRIYATRG
jgi:hypothetical protein